MSARETLRALGVLRRTGVLDPLRPHHAVRSARETLRLGPVAAALRQGARRFPDRVAVVDDAGESTYADLERRTRIVARGLLAMRPDAASPYVVGVLCRDHRGLVLAVAGAGLAGARVVLLNTGLAAPQLADVVEREGVQVLVHDPDLAPAVSASGVTQPRVLADLDSLAALGTDGPVAVPARSGGLVVLTSGTTGVPKGAPRSRVSPLQTAQIIDRLPLPRQGTVVMAAPVFHGTGLSQLTLAMALGNTVVLMRRFDAARAVAYVEERRAEVLVVVPTMLHRILDLGPALAERDLSGLRAVFAAGSALPPALCVRTREALGDVLHNMYGSTEVGVAAVATPDELAVAPGAVGRPPVGSQVRLLGPDRRPVAPGERGTIFVRSSLAFSRYTDGSAKESVDGFLSTGDVGHLDEHGLLHVDGRDDDMIVSGGENLFPREVEELLATHPAVDEVVVLGVPDEEFGQRLRAVVVLRPGATCDADELRDLARSRLARHKVPRDVWFRDSLPRNATGKVLRRELA